jgi:hypothetical protein
MWSERAVVDYALQKRATLAAFRSGLSTTTDVCDPDPYTLRAAKHHGEPTERPCPLCRRESVVELGYTFGEELGQYSGRIRSTAEQAVMAREHGEFRVYVLEVCLDCGWNHLHRSYVLGDGVPRTPPRRRRAGE